MCSSRSRPLCRLLIRTQAIEVVYHISSKPYLIKYSWSFREAECNAFIPQGVRGYVLAESASVNRVKELHFVLELHLDRGALLLIIAETVMQADHLLLVLLLTDSISVVTHVPLML